MLGHKHEKANKEHELRDPYYSVSPNAEPEMGLCWLSAGTSRPRMCGGPLAETLCLLMPKEGWDSSKTS